MTYLAIFILSLAWVIVLLNVLIWARHRDMHRKGKIIQWRRPYDGVVMTGRRCIICGKLTDIRPNPFSYRSMLRKQNH